MTQLEKKATLHIKEEEFKFLGDRLELLHKEFCHWRAKLNLYKRRSRFGEMFFEVSKVMRVEPKKGLFLNELNASNSRLERELDNKINLNLTATKEKMIELLEVYESLRDKIKILENGKVKFNLKIGEKERQLRSLEIIQFYPYRFYGKEMETLKSILAENTNQFLKQPKGPLGTLFSVKLASWVPLVQHILDPYLFIFLVDNRHDANQLEEYISQVYGRYPATRFPENLPFLNFDVDPLPRRPEVWITSFSTEAKDYSKSVVTGSSFPTLMDMLDIHDKDPVVKNIIGKFSRFEKILLFNDEHEAFAELASRSKVPKNCIAGYTTDFFKITPYPTFGTTRMERKNVRAMIVKPSTILTGLLLKDNIKKLSEERDDKFDKVLKEERGKQLEIVLQIEDLNTKCNQLKWDLLKVNQTHDFVHSLYYEIFSSNPELLANSIINGDIHERYFRQARHTAIQLALVVKKRTKVERIIDKLSVK